MDILVIVGFAITGFITVLLLIFMIGFKTEVPYTESDLDVESIKYDQWDDSIPKLLIKHYESIYQTTGMPVIKTVILHGKAKYKISNLWMPVTYHTWVDHGTGFLRELSFYWYKNVILKGVDFWIKGVGALQVNGVIRMNETGKKVTESQLTSFLAETLLLGIFDFSQELLKWDTVNKNSIMLTVSSNNGESKDITITVDFDSKSGRIKCISSKRFRGQQENKLIPWRIVTEKWNNQQGMWVPEYYAKWDDQKRPWCHYSVKGMTINANPGEVKNSLNKITTNKYRTEAEVKKQKKGKY
jgi:hypothetical protein